MRKRLLELDALRGIAALVVALHHLSIIAGGTGLGQPPAFAVDLFFAISGFVMARTYETRLRDRLGTVAFVGLRYRRLFAPLAIGTSLGLLWRLGGMPMTAGVVAAYVSALAFLPAFWTANAFMFNVPAWSLFLEIVSNALHGALFARLSDRVLCFVLCANALAFAVLLSLGLGHWGYAMGPIVSCLPRELCFYLSGILLFRRFGDAPFGRVNGRWAAVLGAISYPLYATHVPVMHLAVSFGMSPAEAMACAITLAAVLALKFEMRRRNVLPPKDSLVALDGMRDQRA